MNGLLPVRLKVKRKHAIWGALLVSLAPFGPARVALAAVKDPLPTQAGDFALRIEPGLALPLTNPQSDLFKLGAGQTIKLSWALNRYFDVGPSVAYMVFPGEGTPNAFGTAWTVGGSVRLKRPHDVPNDDRFNAISPWVDAELLYVRTGPLNRAGLAVGAGLSVPLGQARAFWVGPFVRYLHILQSERTGFDNRDAKILSLGISFEVGSGVRREPEAPVAAEPRTITVSRDVVKEVFVCADRDKDTVPDDVDRCPDVVGPMDNFGCPQYKKIVVKKDKLDLKEKLYFAWNQATIQAVSFPVLDEVVQALNDNKGFRVQVEGHTSSEGEADHNQALSQQRAQAVVDYLVAKGVAKDRLTAKGFGSSVPADTNDTSAGRENNRRVVFVVQSIIPNEGNKHDVDTKK